MRRFFRVLFKLTLLAGIGVGVALAVKKFTAPPPLPDELEPWPPINPDPVETAVDEAVSAAEDLAAESSNGSASDSEASTSSN